MPWQILDAGDDQRFAVDDDSGGVEDRVRGIRPVGCCEDRVARMPFEELAVAHATGLRNPSTRDG